MSSRPDITNSNPWYSFAGIEFTVFTEAGEPAIDETTGGTAIIHVNADGGFDNKVKLPVGNYVVKETYVPEDAGYKLSTREYPVTLGTTWITVGVEMYFEQLTLHGASLVGSWAGVVPKAYSGTSPFGPSSTSCGSEPVARCTDSFAPPTRAARKTRRHFIPSRGGPLGGTDATSGTR